MFTNKKGFLLGEHTLKVIIAVICIILLIALLFGLYSTFVKDKELKQAEESLEQFKIAMENAQASKEEEAVIIQGPSEGVLRRKVTLETQWRLQSWPLGVDSRNRIKRILGGIGIAYSDPEWETVMPDVCVGNGWKDCLCICKTPIDMGVWFETRSEAAEICSDINKGRCIETGFVKVDGDYDYIDLNNPPIMFRVEYIGGYIKEKGKFKIELIK